MTNEAVFAIISGLNGNAGVAQPVEQLICNQQVGGSNPSRIRPPAPSQNTLFPQAQVHMGEFPSGQRGQTVNLLAMPSMVRIHLPPPARSTIQTDGASCCVWVFVKMDSKGRRVRKRASGTFSRRPGPSSDGRIRLPPPRKTSFVFLNRPRLCGQHKKEA